MNQSIIGRRHFLLASGLIVLSPKFSWSDDEIIAPSEPSFVTWQELAQQGQSFEHWTPEEDAAWTWYRLERYVDGDWKSVGISLPVNKETGAAFSPAEEYLQPDVIPAYVIEGELPLLPQSVKRQMPPSQFDASETAVRLPNPEIEARDGKPPSEWLRSLYAEELRHWLAEVDTPETGVGGMTCWVHLIRDHNFDPRRIEGLREREYLLLHSAAHHGY